MNEEFKPLILIFSTNLISDPGIDYTGLSHIHYPSRTAILRLPCSSMVRAEFVYYALTHGFDGVFIAADGSDCPYLSDCIDRTSKRMNEIQEYLKERGIEPERVGMSGICSVCAEPFSKAIESMYERIKELGPVKKEEDRV